MASVSSDNVDNLSSNNIAPIANNTCIHSKTADWLEGVISCTTCTCQLMQELHASK